MIESCLRNSKNEKEGDVLMAKENIMKFFDASMTDTALAGKLAVLAAEHGYGFTAEELMKLGTAQPISDEGVEQVTAAGLTFTSWGPNPIKKPVFPK